MKTRLLIPLVVFLQAFSCMAQQKAVLTFAEAKQLADRGDARAQAIVAMHYQLGWQTEKNLELAVKYAISSTQKGHPLGAFRLGALLRSGDGIPKNEAQGLDLQSKAIAGLDKMAGNPYSLTALGVALFQGKVVREDKKLAAQLYKRAADMGFAPAQFNFAMCAEGGNGIAKSGALRLDFLTRAAENGYNLAVEALNKDVPSHVPQLINQKGIEDHVAGQQKAALENASRQNGRKSMDPSLVFQYRDPSTIVVAENDRLKLVSNSENVLYLLHKRTGLILGQEELGPGRVKSAVLSPSSQFIAIHFHNPGGAGASFRVYDLSSGTPTKVADHWPEAPSGWLNPSNEPSYMRNFSNSVERIGIRENESLLFECHGQLFEVGLLADQSEPRVTRSSEMVNFGQEPSDSKSAEQQILPDGFWSEARFLSASRLMVEATLPDHEKILSQLFKWTRNPKRSITVDLHSLQLSRPEFSEIIVSPRKSSDSNLLLGDQIDLKFHNFDGGRGVGTSIDFGTWAVARNLKSGKKLLFVRDSADLKDDPEWPSLRDSYNSRVNGMLTEAGIRSAPLPTSGSDLAAFNYEHDAFLCKDDDSLIIFDHNLENKKQLCWGEHFEFISLDADLSKALGIKRVGLLAPNYLQLFDINSEKVIGNLVIGSKGAVLADLNGNYMARGPLPTVIGFRSGLEAYPFEQFDLRLNRPDIVLERLGAPDEAIAIAKQLREKRLKRMGVTEDMLQPDFHLPEIEVVGDLPSSTAESELALKIKASDSKYPLDRLRLYVSNVPVNGKEGELLRDAKSQSLDRTIPIKLAAGRNKIQASVLNSAGAKSLYANAEVTCTAQRPKPTLYAVAMGVSEYANPEWNLKYAAKDARDILERVKARSGSSYGEIKELLLTDREATKESLGKIREFLSKATVDDTVLLFVAGHGLLDSKYDYYFGTSDIDFNNPSANGIAFEEFDDLLAELPCLRKSLLIDTCHAGELDEDEKKMLASAQANPSQVVAMLPTGARGMTIKPIEGARGKSEWYDRLQGLFVDLRRGSGSTVLSSSAGAEYALESSEQKNGLFTYAVLEALDGKEGSDANKDGSVTMSELADYVKNRVAALTNNKQSPNVRRVNLEADFALAKK